jgi:coronin-1B/1C/6
MSGRFVRASKYRHVHGQPAKPDKQFTQLRPQASGDGQHITGNGKYFAIAAVGGGGPVTIHSMDKPGRAPFNAPKLAVHSAKVLDFDFNPFMDNMLATVAEDGRVCATIFPDGGLTEDITKATVEMTGHEKKVTYCQFHPTASNVLASASYDRTVRLWDIENQTESTMFDGFGENIHSIAWNENGSLLASTCRDKLIRVMDPRDAKTVISGPGLGGTKKSSVVWLNQLNRLAVVGFSDTGSGRKFSIYDARDLSKPLIRNDIDQSAGVLIPYFDEDTSCLFIGGKGDGSIKYFEMVEDAPYSHHLSNYSDNQSQKGLCWLPKKACDTSKCEIAICLRLMRDSVIPVSFQVPRKSDMFQKDIFPDAIAGIPSATAAEYFAGKNGEAIRKSMNPKDKSFAAGAGAAAEFKAAKSPAQLKTELDAALAKIAELEAEIARLKA